jgi:copper transport protein
MVPAAIVAILLSGTPGFAGHAGTGNWTFYAVVLDTTHVLAMSVWLGGLVVLLLAALGGGFSGGLRHALITFSRVAFTCVVVLVATGLFASWRQVGFRISGYTSTSYGNILLVKLGLVVLLVGLAAISRSIVRRRRAASINAPDSAIAAIDSRTVGGLRRSVGGEVALGLAVLIVTALLVNAQPARSALTPNLFAGSVSAGSGQSAMTIQVTVEPARVGVNEVHVYTLTPKGANLSVRDISAKFVSADGVTSVPANLVKGGPNHYLSSNATFTTPGRYQMLVEVTQIIDGNQVVTGAVLKVPVT